ncbi:hypothetical protein WH47_00636 [Habropoda laboriosa]|uniref:Uncharacterized protein n=1 Tax=Habropoda laboriosa TaxID=597456 RepID=A0A0L7RID9_9HYME|nr:hypothetical protein WH47_00636 [Habropoda laboriosa]
MAAVPGKNKLKMGSASRYYSAYLIYDVANSCLAALHAKMPPPVVVTRTNPPSPVHVQNPRKFSSLCFLFSTAVSPGGERASVLRSPLLKSSQVADLTDASPFIAGIFRCYHCVVIIKGATTRKETMDVIFRDKKRSFVSYYHRGSMWRFLSYFRV